MELFLLALLGVVLILISGYTEWVSVDLAKNSIWKFVSESPRVWAWWTIVGFPFLVGAAYLAAALAAIRMHLVESSVIKLLLGCQLLAAMLLLLGGVGYIATIYCAAMLVYVLLKKKRMR